jgi:hypothetical protein
LYKITTLELEFSLKTKKIAYERNYESSRIRQLQRWGLRTNDAHGLYKQFGFSDITEPELFMELTGEPS